jgi:hypothetical protein
LKKFSPDSHYQSSTPPEEEPKEIKTKLKEIRSQQKATEGDPKKIMSKLKKIRSQKLHDIEMFWNPSGGM